MIWDALNKSTDKIVKPVIASSKYYLVTVKFEDIFFVGASSADANALLIIEFLTRVGDIFKRYFSKNHALNEEILKDNFITVYQVSLPTDTKEYQYIAAVRRSE